MSRSLLCEIFRSPRREGTYLYLERGTALDTLPPALLQVFGDPELVMSIKLDDDRRLAQVEARDVLDAIGEQGFFLQTPRLDEAGRDGPGADPDGG